jgi:predicted Rossmann-fold nucleotide-binding protein
MVERRIIVGVMGSGSAAHEALSVPLGELLARSGVHLLTGGGNGVMAEVSRAFCKVRDRRGLCIGILPSAHEPVQDPATGKRLFQPGAVNRWVEIPVFTHLPFSGSRGTDFMSRNHINVLTADVLIVLPGSAGTLSEVRLRVEYGRPAILFLGRETVDGKHADRIRAESQDPGLLLVAESVEEIPARIARSLEIYRAPGAPAESLPLP